MKINKKGLFYILFFIALIITFLLAYYPHYNYKYPLHADEWSRITQAAAMGNENIEHGKFGYEIGYVYFLNILSKFFNLLSIFKYLAAIFAVLSSICLFLLARYITKNQWLAVLSMLLFSSLKSNVNILGIWFFTPLSMSFPFVFLYCLSFLYSLEKNSFKHYLLSSFLLLIIAIIHPMVALSLLLTTAIYLLLSHEQIIKDYKKLIIIIISLLLLLLLPLISIFIKPKNIIELITFKGDYTAILGVTSGLSAINYSILLLYGILPLILSLIALFYIIKTKNRKGLFFVIWFLLALFFISSFKLFKFTYIIQYERAIYLLLLAMPILTILGVDYLYRIIINKTRLKNILLLILIILLLFSIFFNYTAFHKQKFYSFDKGARNLAVYHCVEHDEFFIQEAERCVYEAQKGYLKYLDELK